jgi:DNA polymerase-3 subunit delta'
MHPAGANSLLKMLEEPPGNSAFVLVSSAPDRLTATVRSRCQRLTLRRPGPETVRAALVAGGFPPERVELGVRLGAGNLRRAQAAARGELDEARGAVEALLRAALAADDGVYWRLTEQLGARDARGELELVLQLCGLYLRDLFLGAGRGAARTMDDRGEVLEQLAASLTLEQVEAAAVELDRADEMLSRNVPANLALVGLWRCLRAGAMSPRPGPAPGSGPGRGARPRAAAS